MPFSDEQIVARLEEAKRMVQNAPPADPSRMTLLDTVIALTRIDDNLEAQQRNIAELRRLGLLTKGDVRLYNQQATTAYRLSLAIRSTLLQRAADMVPFVGPADLARFFPMPPIPTIIPLQPTLGTGLRGPALVIAGVAISWPVLILAALLVLGLALGSIYIVASKAAEINDYALQLQSTERMQRARVADFERCRARGESIEACRQGAEATAPPPPPAPPKSDLDKTMDRIGTYLTWGLIGIAGLTLLPVVVGAVQSLRGLGGEKKRRGGFTITPTDGEYEYEG